jgi:hypothetical protein
MRYKVLYIFVEGEDDKRLFERFISGGIFRQYNLVKTVTYSNTKKEKINNYLRSIKAMQADYIYLRDINNSPCITDKKQKIQRKFKDINSDKVIVVIKEIESWYLAGLIAKKARSLKIRPPEATDGVTKEQFNTYIPKKFDSRIDFMLEILKDFSIEVAIKKNKSFRYFVEKYNLMAS